MPPEKLGDYLRDLERSSRKHGYTAALYGHFGDGVTHCRVDFDFQRSRAWRTIASSCARRRSSCTVTAARCRANMATAGARRAAARSCTATSWSRLPRVQGDLGSEQPAEPGQGHRAFPIIQPAPGPELRAAALERHFRYPDDQARSRTRPPAASASANAAAAGRR